VKRGYRDFPSYLLGGVTLDDAGVGETTGGTRRDDGILLVVMLETMGSGRDEADTGGGERMTDGERATPRVDLFHWDAANLKEAKKKKKFFFLVGRKEKKKRYLGRAASLCLGKLVRVEGVDVGQDLASEGLVDLPNSDIVCRELVLVEDPADTIGGTEEKLVLGVLSNVDIVTEVGKWLVAELEGLLLGHDQGCRGTIGQVRSVAGGDGAVGLDEGGFERRLRSK